MFDVHLLMHIYALELNTKYHLHSFKNTFFHFINLSRIIGCSKNQNAIVKNKILQRKSICNNNKTLSPFAWFDLFLWLIDWHWIFAMTHTFERHSSYQGARQICTHIECMFIAWSFILTHLKDTALTKGPDKSVLTSNVWYCTHDRLYSHNLHFHLLDWLIDW